MSWIRYEGCPNCGCPSVVPRCALCAFAGRIRVTFSNSTFCPCANGYSVVLPNQQPLGWWGDVLPPPFCGYDPVEIFKPALTCHPAPGSTFCGQEGFDTLRFESLWQTPTTLFNIDFEIVLDPAGARLKNGCFPCNSLPAVPIFTCTPFFIQARGVPACFGGCVVNCDPPPAGAACSDGSGVAGSVDITITEEP